MKDESLISIVIPTYNAEKTLAECLESIKNQTYRCIEVIIVDKFSKDRTVEIAKSYGVRVISTWANKPEARNIGILNSRGDYVLLLDSDMVMEDRLVEEAVGKFQKEGCDAIFIDEEYRNHGFW